MRRSSFMLVGLLALALSACGGGDKSGSSADAQELVQETFAASKPLNSGKLQVTATVDAHGLAGLAGPIKLTFAGPFDRGDASGDVPKFDFTLGLAVAGKTYTAGATSTGTQGFLALDKDSYPLPSSEYESLKQSFAKLQGVAQPKTSQGKLDWLSDPTVQDDADVSGVTTKHVSGTVDLGKLLAEISSSSSSQQLTDSQIKAADEAIKDPKFDFYTGKDDHQLRRVTVAFTLDVPDAQSSQLGGLTSADITLDYRVSDLNESQTITAPTNVRPISELAPKLQALQQILGAISSGTTGGSSSGGSSGGGTSTTPNSSGGASPGVSKQAQDYANCIQAAGSDVAKQQKCADLLTK